MPYTILYVIYATYIHTEKLEGGESKPPAAHDLAKGSNDATLPEELPNKISRKSFSLESGNAGGSDSASDSQDSNGGGVGGGGGGSTRRRRHQNRKQDKVRPDDDGWESEEFELDPSEKKKLATSTIQKQKTNRMDDLGGSTTGPARGKSVFLLRACALKDKYDIYIFFVCVFCVFIYMHDQRDYNVRFKLVVNHYPVGDGRGYH